MSLAIPDRDSTSTPPYVLARISVSAGHGDVNFTPFVCWGVYNTKTKKVLLHPQPGTVNKAVRDVVDRLGRIEKRAFHVKDVTFVLTIMDIEGTGTSASDLTTLRCCGSYGTLRVSYDTLRRAEKAADLLFDISRLVERCEWAIDTVTTLVEEDGETISDIAHDLEASQEGLRAAEEKARRNASCLALESLVVAQREARD